MENSTGTIGIPVSRNETDFTTGTSIASSPAAHALSDSGIRILPARRYSCFAFSILMEIH
jgi:hypothetical protein